MANKDIIGVWKVKFRNWTWEYVFTDDKKVTWRDPLNQMTGKGRWSETAKLINILWDSKTAESWNLPIDPTRQTGWYSASYGQGPLAAQKVVNSAAKEGSGPRDAKRFFAKPSFASSEGATVTDDGRMVLQEVDNGGRALVGVAGVAGWGDFVLSVADPEVVGLEKEAAVNEWISDIRVTFKVIGFKPGETEVTASVGGSPFAVMKVKVNAQGARQLVYVDSFTQGFYDPDYRSSGGNWSKYIIVRYLDDVVISLNIDEISSETLDLDAKATYVKQGSVGNKGRLFPMKMNASTVPNLFALKKQAINKMSIDLIDLMRVSREAIIFVLSVSEAARSMLGNAFKQMARKNAPPPVRELLKEGEAAAEGAIAKTLRSKATVQQLKQIASNKDEWWIWRTTDKNVASNQTLKHTGLNTPNTANAPKAIYVTKGFKGPNYGKFGVAVKSSQFRGRATGDALEFIIDGEIPAAEGVWFSMEEVIAAGL